MTETQRMTRGKPAYREVEADLAVVRRETVADGVVTLALADPDGAELPEWTAGAHIDLIMDPAHPGLVRQYSLCGSTSNRSEWVIGVLLDPDSRGGSRFVHDELREGASVRVRGPRNHFPLVHAVRTILFAGGIGITPLLCMAQRLSATGSEFELHYCARSRGKTAFVENALSRSAHETN